MFTTSLIRTPLLFLVLVALGGCPPPRPPVINEFTVAPTNQCATVPVAVVWAADAASGRLVISPATGETPPDPLPSLARGGFRFATARTDTTYTLNVERDGLTDSRTQMVRIVSNPFVTTLTLEFNCTERTWNLPAFSDREYGEVITVESFTNLETQPLLLEFGGQITDLPPGTPTRLLSPVRFAGASPWRARLSSGLSPQCTGGGGSTGGGGPTVVPPPVRIEVRSTCPAPR